MTTVDPANTAIPETIDQELLLLQGECHMHLLQDPIEKDRRLQRGRFRVILVLSQDLGEGVLIPSGQALRLQTIALPMPRMIEGHEEPLSAL